QERWEPQVLRIESRRRMKTLVVFLSQPELQQRFKAALAGIAAGVRVLFVAQQVRGGAEAEDQYVVRREEVGSYVAPLRSIGERHGSVDAILYLWSLEDRSCVADVQAVVQLIQALSITQLQCPRMLLGVSEREPLDRTHAESWIGFERSLQQALPGTAV